MAQMGLNVFVFSWLQSPFGPRFSLKDFTITLRHTTVGGTPLEERSARRKDLYLTTHNTHKRHDIHATGGIRTPQSQQASSRRPTPWTARPLGPAVRIYRVIHKSLRDFRPLRYSSRHGHAEGEHVNRGRDTPSFCPTLQVLNMLNSEGS